MFCLSSAKVSFFDDYSTIRRNFRTFVNHFFIIMDIIIKGLQEEVARKAIYVTPQQFEYGLVQKHILVTGANGQLGNEIRQRHTLLKNYKFFFTDIDELDLCDYAAISDFVVHHNIQYIVNCAAYTAVDKAEDEQESCWKVNCETVGNLAKSAAGKAKVIHVSTDYVFDGKSHRPYIETDPTNPQSIYGKSKLAGEEQLMLHCPENIIIRTAWLYSSFGNNFVKTMLRLGKEKESLTVVADQTGTPTYAGDLAAAILQIIARTEEKQTFTPGIYHYSNEGICTWYDFAMQIHRLAGITTCKIHPIPTSEYPTKATRPMYSVLDKTKIKQTFDIEIPEWEESLEACMALI